MKKKGLIDMSHVVTESEAVRLRKYACWKCKQLFYCPNCKRFECAFSRRVPQKLCAFRTEEIE